MVIKINIVFAVILSYIFYFVIEGNSPYDFTHWIFYIFFPLVIIIIPLLISFIIKVRHFEYIDHYKILKFLGEGGMGRVYKAKDFKVNKIVAIKLLHSAVTVDEEGKKRFRLIEKLSKELKHQNIIRIISTGIWKNQSYFVMEYLKGKTLNQIISKKNQFSLKEIINISLQVAYALKEVHNKNIVHRDVKSDNIFLTDHHIVKLMDFDLARLEKASSDDQGKAFLGTLSYMSPQQAVGESIDHRSDIYSLGVIMYELATGRLPFLANRDMTLIYEIFKNKPISIQKLRKNFPIALEKCILKAMAKEVKHRFDNVNELIMELERINNLLKKRKYYRIK